MFQFLENFHFIRPLWLLALIPLGFVLWGLRRQQSLAGQFQGVVAPHLLEHLVVRPREGFHLRPYHLLAAVGLIMVVAVAGPTWKREPLPFTEDQAPLVIALDLSESMNTQDVAPSRLIRAQQKIRDLLALRAGARTGLLAYAGSAHSVLPLTDDPQILETYLEALSSELMPKPGKDAGQALERAGQMLTQETVGGTVLFMTDGIDAQYSDTLKEFERANDHAVLGLHLALGAPPTTVGLRWTNLTADDTDVRQLNRRIQSHMQAVQETASNPRWQDAGYWLAWPAAGLALVWFRRGWIIG